MGKVFSKLRTFLWPLHREELGRFIPTFLMGFLICFNYYVLRVAKDAFVITAKESGAETLPFLKVWAVVPMALLMTVIFTRFSNYLSRRNVFYAMLVFYIAYFVLFVTVLYPYRDSLHPHQTADYLQSLLPQGCKGFIALFRNWTFTSFYVMAEMWSTMVMTVLFWGFVNDVTTVKDAKRYYGLFAVGTNVAGIAAGMFLPFLSSISFHSSLPYGKTAWDQAVTHLNILIIAIALASIGIYYWLNKKGYGYKEQTLLEKEKEPAVRSGLRSSMSYVLKSKYLLTIAILVVSYNIVMNLVEVIWKDQVHKLYPHPSDFNAYTGIVLFWSSILATSIAIFLSGNIIRKFGWTVSALIPPIATLVSGILFFVGLLLPDSIWMGICTSLGFAPLGTTVFLGSLQHCLLRGTKYSLVDATKEIAFVPLSRECKLKGKAAIDGVGSRLGKSGGALLYQALLMMFGSITATTPFVTMLILGSILGWIGAAKALGKRFVHLTKEEQEPPSPLSSSNASASFEEKKETMASSL